MPTSAKAALLLVFLAACGDKGSGELVLDSGGDDCAEPQLWYLDGDGDGFGDADGQPREQCERPASSWVTEGTDCDDQDFHINPDATEICNGDDDDCDGLVDDDDDSQDLSTARDWYPDEDGDGYGDSDLPVASCTRPEGHISTAGDCNDDDSAVSPAASEECEDGVDNNCNGYTDAEDEACVLEG